MTIASKQNCCFNLNVVKSIKNMLTQKLKRLKRKRNIIFYETNVG